jgi:hypothetical protein
MMRSVAIDVLVCPRCSGPALAASFSAEPCFKVTEM